MHYQTYYRQKVTGEQKTVANSKQMLFRLLHLFRNYIDGGRNKSNIKRNF